MSSLDIPSTSTHTDTLVVAEEYKPRFSYWPRQDECDSPRSGCASVYTVRSVAPHYRIVHFYADMSSNRWMFFGSLFSVSLISSLMKRVCSDKKSFQDGNLHYFPVHKRIVSWKMWRHYDRTCLCGQKSSVVYNLAWRFMRSPYHFSELMGLTYHLFPYAFPKSVKESWELNVF